MYSGAVDMKTDGSVLEEESSFKMLGLVNWVNLVNWVRALALSIILKLPQRKLVA